MNCTFKIALVILNHTKQILEKPTRFLKTEHNMTYNSITVPAKAKVKVEQEHGIFIRICSKHVCDETLF